VSDINEYLHSVDSLKFAISSGYNLDLSGATFNKALRKGNVDVLSWLREQGERVDTHAPQLAVLRGQLDVLNWLWDNCRYICMFDCSLCYNAARCGHLDVLKWLRQRYVPWNSETIIAAMDYWQRTQDWSIVNWAMEHGCPAPPGSTYLAARVGGLPALEHVMQYNMPINEWTMAVAIRTDDEEMIEYLLDRGLKLMTREFAIRMTRPDYEGTDPNDPMFGYDEIDEDDGSDPDWEVDSEVDEEADE
jgi:hypothetical protein